jgi:hypothetical protein
MGRRLRAVIVEREMMLIEDNRQRIVVANLHYEHHQQTVCMGYIVGEGGYMNMNNTNKQLISYRRGRGLHLLHFQTNGVVNGMHRQRVAVANIKSTRKNGASVRGGGAHAARA